MPGLWDCFQTANARRPELENIVFVLLGQLLPPYFNCFYSMKYEYVTIDEQEKREQKWWVTVIRKIKNTASERQEVNKTEQRKKKHTE